MPVTTLWDNYIDTYDEDNQPGMEAFANAMNDSGFDLPDFVKQDIPTISDTIVDPPDTAPLPNYNNLSAFRLQNNISTLLENCTPREQLDNLFFSSVGEPMGQGVRSLVNTLNEDNDLNVHTLEEMAEMLEADLGIVMATLPCSHLFNLARAQNELSAAQTYLDSITTRYQGRFKLTSVEGYSREGLFITMLSDPMDLDSVVATATSNAAGNVSLPFDYIDDGTTPPDDITINIMVYDAEGGNLFEYPIEIDLPLDDSADVPTQNVPVPVPVISFVSATIGDVLTVEGETLNEIVEDYLDTISATPNLRDIRQVGGILNDSGAAANAVRANHDASVQAAMLDAHADLELLSRDIEQNKSIREAGYTSVYKISVSHRSNFVTDTHSFMGDINAYAMHSAAQAVASYFNNYILNWRVQNGK